MNFRSLLTMFNSKSTSGESSDTIIDDKMTEYDMFSVTISQLMVDEGCKFMPYTDTVGKLTIGYGRNLSDVGISKSEALYMLHNDASKSLSWCIFEIPNWNSLSRPRQSALLNMTFNLGVGWIKGWPKLKAALQNKNFEEAANQMEASKWQKQVGKRAQRLVWMMRHNSFQLPKNLS